MMFTRVSAVFVLLAVAANAGILDDVSGEYLAFSKKSTNLLTKIQTAPPDQRYRFHSDSTKNIVLYCNFPD